MSKRNEGTDGTNLKIYSPMGHFLNCKLGLCFRPVSKISIDMITLSHVMLPWLLSLYIDRWRSLYMDILINLFLLSFCWCLKYSYLHYKTKHYSPVGPKTVNTERGCQYGLLAWIPHHSVIKSLSGWRWLPSSHHTTQNEFCVCPHLCRYSNCQEKRKRKGRRRRREIWLHTVLLVKLLC